MGMSRPAWLLFAAMSVVWGIPYFFIKTALADYPPVALVFGRVALAALILLPLALRGGAAASLRGKLRPLAFLGLIAICIPFCMVAEGERHISSSLTGLLISTEPAMIAVLSLWIHRSETVDRTRFAGMLLGMGGVAVLLGSNVGSGGLQNVLIGTGLVLGATLSYSVSAILVKRVFAEVPSLHVAAGMLAFSTLLLAPFAVFQLPHHVPGLSATLAVVMLGTVCTALAYIAFFALIFKAGPARATVVAYLNPAIAVLLGVGFLHEPCDALTIAGLLIVLAGSWISTNGLPPGTRRSVDALLGNAKRALRPGVSRARRVSKGALSRV
jgi:drug/metabolite transporter (DMT)-like permease